jgi:hypothetical protein
VLSAALPPCFAESLRLSGQCRSLRPPPSRLEGPAFQPARRRFFGTRPAERRSLSAHRAAEPQVAADRIEGNLDKPEINSPLQDQIDPLPTVCRVLGLG